MVTPPFPFPHILSKGGFDICPFFDGLDKVYTVQSPFKNGSFECPLKIVFLQESEEFYNSRKSLLERPFSENLVTFGNFHLNREPGECDSHRRSNNSVEVWNGLDNGDLSNIAKSKTGNHKESNFRTVMIYPTMCHPLELYKSSSSSSISQMWSALFSLHWVYFLSSEYSFFPLHLYFQRWFLNTSS